MKDSARYTKIIEWSEEEQCYIGTAPGLFGGGSRGQDEMQVFSDLCQLVEQVIELYHQDGRPLPPATTTTRERSPEINRPLLH